MITQCTIYLFLVIAAFSLAVIFRHRFEEMIPLVFMGIVFFVFLGGMASHLTLGIWMSGIALVLLITYALVTLKQRNETVASQFHSLVTPAFVIFTIIFAGATVFNIGRVPYAWDEFSVWASSVKIMTIWDQFSTVKEAKLLAAVYPPGMACFQFFVQRIYMLFGNVEFSEWRLYFAYQIFVYSLFMPFLRNLRYRKILDNMIVIIILVLAPLFMLEHLFILVYIDTFLGVLFGVGVAFVCLWNKKDFYYYVLSASIMVMLVLSKDAGLFLAMIVGVCLILRSYETADISVNTVVRRHTMMHILGMVIGSLAIPYILWRINVAQSGCHVILTSKVDFGDFFKVLLGKGDATRLAIFRAFIGNLGEPVFSLRNPNAAVTLLGIAVIISVFIFLAIKQLQQRSHEDFTIAELRHVLTILMVCLVLYTFGMLLMYMYKIPDDTLPSYTRYMGIYLLGMTTCGICAFFLAFSQRITNTGIEMALALGLLILAPQNDFADYIAHKYQVDSNAARSRYVGLIDRYNTIWGG